MLGKTIYTYVIFVSLLILVQPISAQNRKTLESKKKKLEQEIALTNKLLSQTRKSHKASVVEVKLLNQNIEKRNSLITEIDTELDLIDKTVTKLNSTIIRQSNDVKTLKNEYAKMLQASYLHKNAYSKLMFILASSDFNQAIRRFRYIREYEENLEIQVELITAKQEALTEHKVNLEVEKEAKEVVLGQHQKESTNLNKEKSQKSKLLKNLKNKEQQLLRDLKQKQKQRAELDNQIKKIIEEEIRRSRLEAERKAREAGKKAATTSAKAFALTPAEKALSANFEGNKAKLPWPTERGSISSKFGNQPHPVLKNVTIVNNGIDIITVEGTSARAVFDGVVTNVGSIYGIKFVMVRHGAYTTVYSNLDKVYVIKGDKIKIKQNIGRIYTDKEEYKTELQFQMWKGTEKLNPEFWIAK